MAKRLIAIFSLWLIVYLGMLGLDESFEPLVPAIYIFGDSTVDVGTNHYLPPTECRARADCPHNGIDFPGSKPTGRFSNGLNTADSIAIQLGYEMSPPPFLSLLDEKKQFFNWTISLVTKGVNFASGGSGILEDTGRRKWGRVIRLGEQVQQFATVRNFILESLGEGAVANISKSLFLISVGSNDIFEYFAYNQSASPQDYITTLMSTYGSRLRNLFDLGAKKFGIISVPPVGCVPSQLNSSGGCFEPMNEHAQLFYSALQALLHKLSSECKGMMYALADAYTMTESVVEKRVFKEVTKACCGKGYFTGDLLCKPKSDVCKDRKEYLFWDHFHPTEAASALAALGLCSEGEFVTPMTFCQLATRE